MDSLSKDALRSMAPERLATYRAELEMVLAQTAMFLSQVTEVMEEAGDHEPR